MASKLKLLIVAVCLVLVTNVDAQTPPTATPSKPLSTSLGVVVFPAKGQTAQQQSQDEGECYGWSKGQTGVDPLAPPPAAAPPPAQPAAQQQPTGARAKGAVRGAAAGAVIGEVADNDAGTGAAVGATVGVVKGGAQARKQQEQAKQQAAQQQQQAAAQQKATADEQRKLFNNGFGACLESKGYTVK